MTARQYRKHRMARGTVKDVADSVGVHVMTINKRERGEVAITRQAEIALLALPKLDKPVEAHTLGRRPLFVKKKARTKARYECPSCKATSNNLVCSCRMPYAKIIGRPVDTATKKGVE